MINVFTIWGMQVGEDSLWLLNWSLSGVGSAPLLPSLRNVCTRAQFGQFARPVRLVSSNQVVFNILLDPDFYFYDYTRRATISDYGHQIISYDFYSLRQKSNFLLCSECVEPGGTFPGQGNTEVFTRG
jgi:hypothetical protein